MSGHCYGFGGSFLSALALSQRAITFALATSLECALARPLIAPTTRPAALLTHLCGKTEPQTGQLISGAPEFFLLVFKILG